MCVVTNFSRLGLNRVAKPARGQPNKENEGSLIHCDEKASKDDGRKAVGWVVGWWSSLGKPAHTGERANFCPTVRAWRIGLAC